MERLFLTSVNGFGIFRMKHRFKFIFAYLEEKEARFGSLLRSFRVNKSTNQLMCRDLNGRRLASIDEEQKLRKWIERAAEREKEKIAKRNAKYEKLKSGPPKHMFNDPDYIRFVEYLKDAQEKKASRPVESSSDSDFDINDLPGGLKAGRKRKATKMGSAVNEKMRKLDEEHDSDSDSEENDVDPQLILELQEYFSGKDPSCGSSKTDEPCGSKDRDNSEEAEESAPLETEQAKTTSENGATKSKETTSAKEQTNAVFEGDVKETEKIAAVEDRTKVAPEKGVTESEEFADVDLTQYSSAKELEALGLKHLKHALTAMVTIKRLNVKKRPLMKHAVQKTNTDIANNKKRKVDKDEDVDEKMKTEDSKVTYSILPEDSAKKVQEMKDQVGWAILLVPSKSLRKAKHFILV
ncbi:hypothetical protein ANCDUO_09256 [Ancylostoma duodenale]|uniref:Uncharacterized protein n=1 Tax=Ancylostoma duodenale TaxID=51022 RepID=A0A0C2CUB4_9BILA|nr:hypothetical protein ANCDUO_09256 [Ancylostoma duodenale]